MESLLPDVVAVVVFGLGRRKKRVGGRGTQEMALCVSVYR